MPPKPKPSQWLIFIPLSGLVLTGEQKLEGKYLFGDVNVISRETFLRHFTSLEDNTPTSLATADAYLVLRRKGVVNTRWFDEDRKNEQFMAEAGQRAKQIAALLTLYFLASSDEGVIVRLDDQQFLTQTHFGILGVNDNQERLLVGSYGPLNNTFTKSDPEAPVLSSEGLEQALHQPLVAALTQVFEPKSALGGSLRDSIIQASVRLATAIHAPTYTDQLLGAVTSIEILLSGDEQSPTFKMKQTRLETLIGKNNAEKYEFDQVLRARHAYVHKGEDTTDRRLPLQAICAALHTLLIYAQVAHKLKSKNALITMLDIINLGGKLTSSNPGIPINLDAVQLAPLYDEHPFPYADFVESALETDELYNAGMYDRADRVFDDDELTGDES
jgi:hypothetical protein